MERLPSLAGDGAYGVMADYLWPVELKEGQTGTELVTNLIAQFQGGSDIRTFLNASAGTTSRNLDSTNLCERAGIRAAQLKPSDLTSAQFAGHQSVNLLQKLIGDNFAKATITAAAIGTATVGRRALGTRHPDRPAQICWTQGGNEGCLRGELTFTITAGNSAVTVGVDWTTGTSPTVRETKPTAWTTPTSITVELSPRVGIAGTYWCEYDATTPTYTHARVTETGVAGFTIAATYFNQVAGTWVPTNAAANRGYRLGWYAQMNHA